MLIYKSFFSFEFLKMAKQISIKYFEESEFSKKPEQATKESAGYDLYAADTITIFPKTAQTIPPDLRFAVLAGFFWPNFSSVEYISQSLSNCRWWSY